MRARKVSVASLLDQFGEDRRGRFGEDVLEGGGIPDEDRIEAEPVQRGRGSFGSALPQMYETRVQGCFETEGVFGERGDRER